MTAKEVAEACGTDRTTANRLIGKLMHEGTVVPAASLPPNAVFFKFPETKGFGLHIRTRMKNLDANGEIKSDAMIYKLMSHSSNDYWTVRQIAEATGLHMNTVRRSLARMEGQERAFRKSFPDKGRGRPADRWSDLVWDS